MVMPSKYLAVCQAQPRKLNPEKTSGGYEGKRNKNVTLKLNR